MIAALKWFWRLYFVYMTLMFCVLVCPFQASTLPEWLDLAIMIPSLIGLFGYVFDRKILFPEIWKLFFVILVLWDIYFHFVIELTLISELTPRTLVFLLTLVPLYIALFHYGFLSDHKKN
ncbi:MAG: hypothetical protein JW774_12555 [Candidatus Aureabacteria bacterium]|nr:hypothetical protein [Candidatus Auribacterota bacterium]